MSQRRVKKSFGGKEYTKPVHTREGYRKHSGVIKNKERKRNELASLVEKFKESNSIELLKTIYRRVYGEVQSDIGSGKKMIYKTGRNTVTGRFMYKKENKPGIIHEEGIEVIFYMPDDGDVPVITIKKSKNIKDFEVIEV